MNPGVSPSCAGSPSRFFVRLTIYIYPNDSELLHRAALG